MFRSATFKLTMWYVAIVMAISLFFSGVVYHVATDELARGLTQQTQRWYNAFPGFDDDPFFTQNTELNAGRRDIFWRLAYFNLLVLAAASIVSYLLARRTLSPIEAAHDRQKRFTADVSHELRTPLTALRMESEVALMDKSASKQALRDTLQSNIEESQKLEALVNNLLRLTQLEANQLDEHFTPVKLSTIIDDAMANVAPLAQAKHIRIQNNTKNSTILGDYGSLVQLVLILLDNAVKYSTDKSSVQIDSHTDRQSVYIEVKDKGSGIDPEALKHVFDRFYRTDKARKSTETSGFGLGLSIAKSIVDIHGGTIELTSKPGVGTTATVVLPKNIGTPAKNKA